ncbi:MAG TPA: phosphoribosylanthranilate isomerase [Thermoanaerobaculia bacterium]
MTEIKICGITRGEDALVCAELGADFIGFIFVPFTPRYIEPEAASAIADLLAERAKGGERSPKIVGVFRDSSVDYVRQIASVTRLDAVQLHGSETDDDIRELGLPAIKTFRIDTTLPDTSGFPNARWLLFDAFDEQRAGGTGRRFDWSLLSAYPRTQPFFLAGGLRPENVAAAISAVRPDAIDVSSGVEQAPGIKDHDRLRLLFERVRGS